MKRLRFGFAVLALAVVGTADSPRRALAAGCPNEFWSPATGYCYFTGYRCGGDGCWYDCDVGYQCYGPWGEQ